MSDKQTPYEVRLRKAEVRAIADCDKALDALYEFEEAPQIVDGILGYLAHTRGFNVSVHVSKDYSWLPGTNTDKWFYSTLDGREAAQRALTDARKNRADKDSTDG